MPQSKDKSASKFLIYSSLWNFSFYICKPLIFTFSLFGFSSSSIYKRLFQNRAKTESDMVSWFPPHHPQETGDKFLGNFSMNPPLECRCSYHKMAVVHASVVDSFISLLIKGGEMNFGLYVQK